jgi:hypothetical protein
VSTPRFSTLHLYFRGFDLVYRYCSEAVKKAEEGQLSSVPYSANHVTRLIFFPFVSMYFISKCLIAVGLLQCAFASPANIQRNEYTANEYSGKANSTKAKHQQQQCALQLGKYDLCTELIASYFHQ